MKFSLSALMAAALLVSAPMVSAQNVAIVNGKAVPASRLEALVKQVEASGRPVDDATRAQIKEIAEKKIVDLNCDTIESAMRMIEGSARSMGLEVVG